MCSISKSEECLSLISNLSAEVARLTKRLEKLERREEMLSEDIDDIKAELKTKNKRNKYELGKYLREWEAAHTLSRKEIVEQAKADIEALKSERYYIVKIQTNPPFSQAGCNVEFIVNRKKRTVVALLKGSITGRVYERGVAKCAPNDCFNEYIGKAIALRRALGREVPQEYTNAPQPEGVEVGDIVRVGDRAYQTARGRVYSVVGTEDDGCLVKAHNLGRKGRLTWVQAPDVTVIDDSDREEYR